MTFTPVNADISRRRTASLSLSLAFHGILLGWLLYPPTLNVLAPSSVAAGVSGGSITTLYWPTHEKTTNDLPGIARLEQREVRKRLIWKKQPSTIRRTQPPEPVRGPMDAQAQSTGSSLGNPSPPAGTPYGSHGSAFGDEVRPALPINAYEPVVDPNELPGHVEGSIVVEITIDDKGTIVQKTVLQSLGPAIDNKVLAALENWHFRPATRNGVAIPSKQDVYYHFKPQGLTRDPGGWRHSRYNRCVAANSIQPVASADFPTRWGKFRIFGFEGKFGSGESLRTEEAVALVMGDVRSATPLVRIHSQCLTGDVFGSLRCDCRAQLEMALAMIAEEGAGVLIYEQQEGRGIGLMAKLRAYELQDAGLDTVEANQRLGFKADHREFTMPAEILKSLGISRVRLLSNNPDKVAALERGGIEVTERVPCEVATTTHAEDYLKTKKDKMGHLFTSR